jgi:hypothetical protein
MYGLILINGELIEGIKLRWITETNDEKGHNAT